MLTVIIILIVSILISWIIFRKDIENAGDVLISAGLGAFGGLIISFLVFVILALCCINNESMCENKVTHTYNLCEYKVNDESVYVSADTQGKTLTYSMIGLKHNIPTEITAEEHISIVYDCKSAPNVRVKEYEMSTSTFLWIGYVKPYKTYEITIPSKEYIHYE